MTTQQKTHPGAACEPLHRRTASRWAPLPVVLAGTFMVVLDFFIVNVALPSMQHDLHAGSGAIEWVVAGYSLTSAVLLITAARLGDQIGRRRMFSLGLAVFTLASAACGLANSPAVLVLSRLVQGAGAAMLMPNVLAIIGVTYTGADLGRALGAYGLVMGVAAVSGQLVGGVLGQANVAGLAWRSCFLINIPVGALALIFAPRVVPESRTAQRRGLDLVGTVLITAGLTAVLLPLVEGRQHGWPLWSWASLAAAPVILVAFAAHQRGLGRRGGAPLLSAALFATRSFSAGLITQLAFWSGRHRSSWSSRSTSSKAAGSPPCRPGWCSRSSPRRTSRLRLAPPHSWRVTAGACWRAVRSCWRPGTACCSPASPGEPTRVRCAADAGTRPDRNRHGRRSS